MDEATRLRLIEQIDRDLERERGAAQEPRFPDWSTPPEAAPPRGGHFTRGISHGLRSLGATGAAAVGLAADQAGAQRLGDAAMDRYSSMMEGIEAESLPEYNVGNWETLGDAGRAALYWTGNVGAQIVPSIVTGGVVGLGARGLTREAARQEAGRRAQSEAMQRQIREQAQARASGTTAAATRIAEDRTRDVIARDLLARNQNIGFVAGSSVPIFPQTLGAAYGEAAQLADEQGLDRSSIDVGRVLAGGGGAGLAGVGQTLATAGLMRFGPARNVFDMLAGPTASRASRVATRGATGAAAAGGTEALQEQLIYYGAGGEGVAPADRLLTAAFAGGVFGGAVGGASGVPQPPPTAAPPLNPFRTATDEEIASRLQELPRVQDPAVAERVARDEARAAERAQQQAERERIISEAPPRPVPEVTLTRPKGISEEVWSTVPRLEGRLNNVIQTLFDTPGLGKRVTREGPARDIDLNQRGRAALNAWKDAQVKAAEAAGLQKPAGVTDQAWRNLVSEIAGESNPFAVRARASRVKGMTRGPKLETFMEQWNAPAATDPVQAAPVDPLATAPDTNQTTPPATTDPVQTPPAATDPVQTPPAGLDSLRSLLSGDLPNMRAVRQVVADSIAGGDTVALRNIDVVRDDPAFNVVDTPEGVPVVAGVQVDPDGPWVGTAPTEAPVPTTQTPVESAAPQPSRSVPAAQDYSQTATRRAVAALLGEGDSVVLRDPEATAAVKADPAYNTVDSPDGSTTITGVQIAPGDPWVGQPPAPAATPASFSMPPQPDAPDVVRVAQQFDADNPEYVASLEDSISKLLDVLYNQTDEATVADLEVVTPPDQKAPSPSAETPDAPTAQTENADKRNLRTAPPRVEPPEPVPPPSLRVAPPTKVRADTEENVAEFLEESSSFDPPAAPTLQNRRRAADGVVAKGKRLTISGGSRERDILSPTRRREQFDSIGYDGIYSMDFPSPEVGASTLAAEYGPNLANIGTFSDLLNNMLGAHFSGGVAINDTMPPELRPRVVAHELGHAAHSLLGDTLNQNEQVLSELAAIEGEIYPGLRQRVSDAVADGRNIDVKFFNYLLSAEELIAEFNVLRLTNPDRATEIAPTLSDLLSSVSRREDLVKPRKAMPSPLGLGSRAVGERLKVANLATRQSVPTDNSPRSSKAQMAKYVLDLARSETDTTYLVAGLLKDLQGTNLAETVLSGLLNGSVSVATLAQIETALLSVSQNKNTTSKLPIYADRIRAYIDQSDTSLSAMGVRTELTRGARGNHWDRADGKRMTPTDVRGLFYALGGITDNHLPESLSGRDSWLKAAQQIGHAEAWAPGVIDVTNRIHNTLKALDRVTKEVGDLMDGKNRGAMVDPTSFAQERVRLNQRLAQEFAELERLVGRRNLLVMQRLTKGAIALRVMEQADVLELFAGVSVRGVSAIKRKGAQKAPKELPPQARYSRAFRDYRLGRTTSELLHPRIIRDMWERQKGNADYQANRMLLGKSLPEGLRRRVQGRPTDAVVQYLGFNAAQPWQRAVVRLIDRALKKQNLLEPGAIDWSFSKAKTGPKGELGTYQPYTDRPGGKITIYQNGHTNTVILHELIHAATVSALDTMANRPNVRAAVSDAERITKALVRAYDKQGESSFTAAYGENTRLALAALKAAVESGDRTVIASELLSYGLTDSGVQQFMLDTRLPQPKATSMINWMWKRFVDMISKLLRFSAGDPTRATNIEPFLTTSARIFYQITQNNALLKDATAAKRDALAAMGTIPPRPSGAFSATAMSQQTKHAKAAAAAAANAEAGEAHTRSVEAALRRKTAADAEAALAQRQEKERKQIVAAEEITASTAIQKPDSATRDVLFFDRWGRGAFDAVLSAITSGKHSDFEARVESLRQASATKFQEFLRSDHTGPNGEMTPMEQFRRLVSYTATSLGIGVGLDRQTRSIRFRTMNADKTRGYNLGELMQTLHTINAEEASGVLRYIENPTVAELESITPDPEMRSAIRMLGEGLTNAFAEAKRLRLIDARFDAENLTILDFVRLNDKETFRRTANAAVGKVTPNFAEPGRGPYRHVDPLTPHDIIGKDGNINRNVKRGDKLKLARIIESGQVVAVDPAITHKIMQDKGLTYHNVELDNVFTVRQIRKKSASNEMASIVLGKLLTAEELQARKVDATTIASLVTAVHDWSRAAEFAKFRERLTAHNETLPMESRMILDAPPEGASSDRVFDAPKRLSDTRPVFADAMRLPGNWVSIPADARGMWEPFRGKYLAAPLFSSIADMYNTTPHIQSPTMRLVMGVWKKHMTVWSPITWQHNIIGNLMFSYFHDIPARNIKLGTKLITHQMMPNIAKKYLPPLTKNEQAILNEIKAAGIELVSYKHQEIDRDSLDSLRNLTMQLGKTGDSSSVRDLTAVNTILQGIFSAYVKTDAAFSDFYSNQDNVFRAAAYITYLENAQARGEPVTETLLAQAGQYAREAFVDYQIDAPFINAIRFGRLGGVALPFIAWTYRATGIMAKTAITKPWKLLAVYGAISAINAMAYGFLGADEEEERAILPEYMSRNVWGLPGAPRYMRLPFGDAENAVHYNLSSAIPLANVFEAADYGNLPGTLMPGGPTMIAIEAIFNYQFFRQQPITTEMDMFTAQHGKDFLTFAARSLGPRIIVDGFATGNDILVQRQGPTGSDPSRWIQLARTLGFNLRETDMFDARYYQSLDVQRIQRETAAAQNRVMRDYLRRGVEPDWDRAYEDVLRVAERGQQRILDRLGIED